MNKTATVTIFTAILLVFALSLPAAAQTSPDQLKGKQIRNEQGEKLGTIEDVMVGPDGEIEAVTVEKGGFFGIGGEKNRISWNDLKQGGDPGYLVYIPGGTQEEDDAGGYLAETPGDETEKTQASAEQEQAAEPERQAGLDQQESGQVLVQQPGAKVAVDQSEPQIQVKQPEPKVDVQQEPPKVMVKQPAPQIEVKVKQPKPEVSVQQQQPTVDVQQEEPMVSVQQEKPEVQVQQEKPQVTVQKSEPEVQVEDSGQAQVSMEEQEQAQVEIEKQGEPEVEVITEQQQKEQRQEDEQQMAQRQQEQQMKTAANIEPAKADEWLGQELVGKAGETLGTVQMNYLSEDRNSVVYLIVQGDENKMHPVPADVVRVDPDKNELMADIDKQTFQGSPSFSEQEKPKLDQEDWSQEIRAYYGPEGGQTRSE